MRFLAATLVILCGCAVTPAQAYDGPQPLTRAACDSARLMWDDNANVCTSEPSQAPQNTAALEVPAATTGQPLTRAACERAGLPWDDNANVCDATLEPVPVDVAAPAPAEILINIDKAKQTMVVSVDGKTKYTWPVSTGRPGYSTPSGSYTPGSMNEMWYSKQWDNAPMPHAIFFTKEGHAIHGSYDVKHLGRPASHGCVRISPTNATNSLQPRRRERPRPYEGRAGRSHAGGRLRLGRRAGARQVRPECRGRRRFRRATAEARRPVQAPVRPALGTLSPRLKPRL